MFEQKDVSFMKDMQPHSCFFEFGKYTPCVDLKRLVTLLAFGTLPERCAAISSCSRYSIISSLLISPPTSAEWSSAAGWLVSRCMDNGSQLLRCCTGYNSVGKITNRSVLSTVTVQTAP